ncbi:hypothetical protein B0J11DRAFT_585782 [Dendryphion nanum]|uniref:JmjC domain-containing protein n=1 Tax=Dendryphion nanum TaxID=256645 RepID=A0A9P9D3Q0_9PLEO|nr:hypothetical protein B0J11DRAFT_585782 [Dendryphion nanum]
MRAPHQRSIDDLFVEISAFVNRYDRTRLFDGGRQVEEDWLLDGYLELHRQCTLVGPGRNEIFARIATLSPKYVGSSEAALSPGDHIVGLDGDVGGCPVLAISHEQLRHLHDRRKSLPDQCSVLVIPAATSPPNLIDACDDTLQQFKATLGSEGWEESEVESQNYRRLTEEEEVRRANAADLARSAAHGHRGNTDPSSIEAREYTNRTNVRTFLDNIRSREAGQTTRRIAPDLPYPENYLNLSGATLGMAFQEPEAITLLGYRLLSFLAAQPRTSIPVPRRTPKGGNIAIPTPGKEYSTDQTVKDLEACLRWLLFGYRGSYSPYHTDILNGTWGRVVSGGKLWLFYCGDQDPANMEQYAKDGAKWAPPQGSVKGVFLRPGDTIMMRPGYPVIHAVLTIEDSLMMGGMVWPERKIASLMENLRFMLSNGLTSNELMPRQLPDILDRLRRRIVESQSRESPIWGSFEDGDCESVDRLVAWAKDAAVLHCDCRETKIKVATNNDISQSAKHNI